MHLVLLWLVLLPNGKTLSVDAYFRNKAKTFDEWLNIKVPSFAVKCFIMNICWIYLIAGLTKIPSEMWRDGFALYPVFLLPISRMPEFWKPEYFPYIKVATYFALFTEISLPFFLLSPRNSLRKWIGLLLQIGFHVGIIATLRIPFANLAMLGSIGLIFRKELMKFIFRIKKIKPEPQKQLKFKYVYVVPLFFCLL